MKRYGFFGGAFNPPTFAHIALANYTCQKCKLDKLFFVPVGNHYQKKDLIDETHRFKMLEIACEPYNKQLKVSDIELGKDKSYTAIEVFELIKQQYPNDELYFIMGADNLAKLSNWNRAKELVNNFHFIILERNIGVPISDIINIDPLLKQYQNHFQIIHHLEYKNMNSREVRKNLKENKDISQYISQGVLDYINLNNLYR